MSGVQQASSVEDSRGRGRGVSREKVLSLLPLPLQPPPQLVSPASLKAPRSMVAAFDYNPRESSPNMDVEVRTRSESPVGKGAGGRASPS